MSYSGTPCKSQHILLQHDWISAYMHRCTAVASSLAFHCQKAASVSACEKLSVIQSTVPPCGVCADNGGACKLFACMQFSLLNSSVHDQWQQQGAKNHTMDEHSRMACEVLRSRKAGKVGAPLHTI